MTSQSGGDNYAEKVAGIAERYRRYVRRFLGRHPLEGLWGMRTAAVVIASAMCLSIVGIPAGRRILAMVNERWPLVRRMRRQTLNFLRHAEPLMGYLISVGEDLLGDDEDDGKSQAAALLLVDADAAELSAKEMFILAERVIRARIDSVDPDEVMVAGMVNVEEFVWHRRRRLPDSYTNGRRIYLCDIKLHRGFLHNQRLEIPMIPCMGERGDMGRLMAIPWWIAVGTKPPKGAPDFAVMVPSEEDIEFAARFRERSSKQV